jgi:enoyl-CoA hydratase/carnithine racemase
MDLLIPLFQVADQIIQFEKDKSIGAIILTGSQKAFAGEFYFPCLHNNARF